MLSRVAGVRPFDLTGPQGQTPAWAAGATLQFDLDNLPILTDEVKANYLLGITLTAFGTLGFTTEGSAGMPHETLYRMLFASFDLQGAWHGRPLAGQHVRGANLPLIEYIGCGLQTPTRRIVQFDTGNEGEVGVGAPSFFLPLGHFFGDNPEYSAQLALLFKDASLQINCTTGTTFTDEYGNIVTFADDVDLQIRASAQLLPSRKIRLAPGSEWIEYRQTAAAGSPDVNLTSLGNASALEGIEPGAAIDTMIALTSVRGQGGSFTADLVSQFSAPLCGITQINGVVPLMHMAEAATQSHGRPHDQLTNDGSNAGDPIADYSGIPYTRDATGQEAANVTGLIDSRALFVPIKFPNPKLQTSKLDTFEGTATYYRTLSANPTGAEDRTLVHQYKSWNGPKVEDFRQLVVTSRMAEKVLGTRAIRPKVAQDEARAKMNPAHARFLPIEWEADVPAAK